MAKYKPIKNFLSTEELREIERAIGAAEKTTIGEIKVVINAKSHKGLFRVFDPLKAAEMRAIHEFKKMGVHKTKDRTGVLIMVSVSERRIRIIADEGIHRKVEDGAWERIVEAMSGKIKEGKPKDALVWAVTTVGETLAKHFPARIGQENELSDEVAVEE